MLNVIKAFVEVHPVLTVVVLGLVSTTAYMAVQVYGFAKPHPEQAATEVERGKPVEVVASKETQRTDAEDKDAPRGEA